MNLPDMHSGALASTRAFLAAVEPGQWHDPTPCAEYDVRMLVNHIVSGNFWVAPLVGGSSIADVGDKYDGDVLGDDPLATYERSAGEADAAFSAPGAMQASVAVSYGPVPGEVYAGHRFIDVLIHGWDLATATGQDAELDAGLVEACWEVVTPQAELLKGSGMFGSEVEVPPDANPQTRLLALLGRRG
ncbi:MAG: TIGR03086 family protein [Actinobacteria bacterium]|nr:MAG: TIGR03086 family protein [Actinomycetota bacterium]